ncbi:MAG: nucleoside-diphosphate kinase [Candidatus Pacebacteria bacterium]|nr:nucleoside-diphosphate kinase [Candidatus Paceibacterota bacterium]MBP9701139.1 nucleoside-diphosphate kinase [Candidatus Paceibacterota bacterium]
MIHKKEEQSLIIFKPDAVQRGVVGEILSRFERAGLKIVGVKMIRPDRDHYFHHYETIGTMVTRHGQKIFDATLEMMSESPVIACVLEGVEAASLIRKMVGATEPKGALPGTIRGDYAHLSYGHADGEGLAITNLIHASGNANEAKAEIAHWFSESELFEYETVHEKFTQRKQSHLKK